MELPEVEVMRRDLERDVVEERQMAVRDREMVEGDERHLLNVPRRRTPCPGFRSPSTSWHRDC